MKRLFLAVLFLIANNGFIRAVDKDIFIETDKELKDIYHRNWIDFNKNGKKDAYEDSKAPIDDRINDLLNRMNLKEKTCQMATLYGYARVAKDMLPQPDWKNEIWKDGIGNIDEHLNNVAYHPEAQNEYGYPHSKHARAINTVQRFFVEETRLGIPVDFTNEGIRGLCHHKATGFPAQTGIGSTWDVELVQEVGRITGEEARSLGYTNVYSPILDLPRDPRWGRIVECYGESPYLVAELGKAQVKSIQENKVVSTPKHFALYSIPKGGRDAESRTDPHVAPREMHTLLLTPFREAFKEAGALGTMSSYNDYDGIPITGSKYFLTDLLREKWGFEGYVVSDSRAVGRLSGFHKVAEDYKEAVRQSVMAGLNIRTNFTPPSDYILPLRELVQEGSIPEKIINERVKDILRVKFWLGLFDSPYVKNPKNADKVVRSKENQKISLQASRESIVLLKNEKDLLPIDKKSLNSILVTGPLAKEENHAISRYGPSHIDVVSVLEGIKTEAGNDLKIKYTKGCELIDENFPRSDIMDFPISSAEQTSINQAKSMANNSDLVIVVIGEDETLVGEGRTRATLDLPGNQLELIKSLHSTGTPVVAILLNGRPLSINWTNENIPAIVEAWFPGENGGTALADVIFGNYNPGGKLPFTFPKSVGQIKFNFPFKRGSQNPPANWDWLTRGTMIDDVIYPFGHGLSYTSFEYSNLKIEPKKQYTKGDITVTFDIKNTGDMKGDEVVQLYISDLVSSVVTYESMLKRFDRITLKPKQTETVEFKLRPEDLRLLDKDMEWVVEPGEFEVRVGSSSKDIRLKENFEIR